MNPFQVRVKGIHIGSQDTGKGGPLSMNGLTKIAYILTNLHLMYRELLCQEVQKPQQQKDQAGVLHMGEGHRHDNLYLHLFIQF